MPAVAENYWLENKWNPGYQPWGATSPGDTYGAGGTINPPYPSHTLRVVASFGIAVRVHKPSAFMSSWPAFPMVYYFGVTRGGPPASTSGKEIYSEYGAAPCSMAVALSPGTPVAGLPAKVDTVAMWTVTTRQCDVRRSDSSLDGSIGPQSYGWSFVLQTLPVVDPGEMTIHALGSLKVLIEHEGPP